MSPVLNVPDSTQYNLSKEDTDSPTSAVSELLFVERFSETKIAAFGKHRKLRIKDGMAVSGHGENVYLLKMYS